MALQNEILVGRFNRALQKLLGIKGAPPTPQVSPEFVPHLNVPTGQEELYLWGFELFTNVSVAPAIVAQFSTSRFRNPVGSKVVAEITRMLFIGGAAADAGLALREQQNFTGPDAQVVDPPTNLDPRTRIASTCVVSHSTAAIAGLASRIGLFSFGAGALSDLLQANNKQFLPVLPGQAYEMLGSVVNNGFTVNWWWRERPLEESELT